MFGRVSGFYPNPVPWFLNRIPFKVKGIVLGTNRQHTYRLRIHGKNPEISKSYLNGIIEEYNLPDDAFTKR